MKIDEVIEKLQEIKGKYGNLDVIGVDNYDINSIELQKFIEMIDLRNNIIDRHIGDLNNDYLENIHTYRISNNSKYSKRIISKGICVKIYW